MNAARTALLLVDDDEIFRERLGRALRDRGYDVVTASSHATAMDECRAALEYKYNSYAAWGMESPTASMTFEEMARDRFIIGDKVSVKEEIARWQERLGVNHFVMRVQWPGLEQEKVLNSIRRLGEIFA